MDEFPVATKEADDVEIPERLMADRRERFHFKCFTAGSDLFAYWLLGFWFFDDVGEKFATPVTGKADARGDVGAPAFPGSSE